MLDEGLELEVEIELDDELVIIDYDEISIETSENNDEENDSLPKNYLYIKNLILVSQVCGVVEGDDPDLIVVPAYAEKNGEPKFFGYIELTSENILDMQNLGLDVSLMRKGKDPVMFDKAEDYIQIIKTCKFKDIPENHLYLDEEENEGEEVN